MTDVVYAIALLLNQVDPSTFVAVTEPVKMVMEECIKQASLINMDNSIPYILTCTPFTEVASAS